MAKQKYCIDCGKPISEYATRCKPCDGRHRSSSNCHLWKGGLTETTCEWCGIKFDVKPSRLKRGRGKFCSQRCKGKAHSVAMQKENNPMWVEKLTRTCKQCETEFEIVPSVASVGGGIFCSKECHSEWMSENLHGEHSIHWQGRTLDRKCENCGRPFKAPACVVEDGKGRFCSRDCYGAYYSGERRPQWEGGKSFEPYPPEFNERFKDMIRERDGHRCVLCGMTTEENGRKLAVHHVTYDKDNIDPGLKVSLCNMCHGRTNYNRAFWTTVFTQYWRRVPVQDWQHRQVVT